MAHESLHSMHNRRSGKRGYLALKLDVSKTYDRVEWYFPRGIMVRLGLLDVWIDRVMKCVTTPTFLVCINGKAYGKICPTRGIRQGDPISPYLFLLCVEGFSSLLAKAERERQIHDVSICGRVPSISHLLFVDESTFLPG